MSDQTTKVSAELEVKDNGATANVRKLTAEIERFEKKLGQLQRAFSKPVGGGYLASLSNIQKKLKELDVEKGFGKRVNEFERAAKAGKDLTEEYNRLGASVKSINAQWGKSNARIHEGQKEQIRNFRAIEEVMVRGTARVQRIQDALAKRRKDLEIDLETQSQRNHKAALRREDERSKSIDGASEARLKTLRMLEDSLGKIRQDAGRARMRETTQLLKAEERQENATFAQRLRLLRGGWAQQERERKQAATDQRREDRAWVRETNKHEREHAANQKEQHETWMRGVRTRFNIMQHDWKVEDEHHRTRMARRQELRQATMSHFGKAASSGYHAVQAVQHPFFQSPAFAAMEALTVAIVELTHVMGVARKVDDAATQMGIIGFDADKSPAFVAQQVALKRQQFLSQAIGLGTSPESMMNIYATSIRQGVKPELAESMPAYLTKYANALNAHPEQIEGSTDEAIQQLIGMNRIKTGSDVYSFLNAAQFSANHFGNDPEKMNQFFAAGGIGRGSELHLDTAGTIGLAGLFDARGARTGWTAAKFMEQLAGAGPRWSELQYNALHESGASPDRMLKLNAHSMLGYGSMNEMINGVTHGGEAGIVDFIGRFKNVKDENQRKRLAEVLQLGSSGGGIIEEILHNPDDAKSYLAQVRKVYGQTEGGQENGKLTADMDVRQQRFQQGLSFMEGQIVSAFDAIEAQIGDGFKTRIIKPFSEWFSVLGDQWQKGLSDRTADAIDGFIKGLGFTDLTDMLKQLQTQLTEFDYVGFARGLGEGVRAVASGIMSLYRAVKSFVTLVSDLTGADVSTIGKLGIELAGFALVLHTLSPVIGIVRSLSFGIKTLGYTLTGLYDVYKILRGVAGVGALAGAAEGAAGTGVMAALGTAAVAALPITLAAVATGLAISAIILNWGEITGWWSAHMPAWLGGATPDPNSAMDRPGDQKGSYGDDLLNAFKQMSYEGGSSWRDLLTPASYTDDASRGNQDRVANAVVLTSLSVQKLVDLLQSRGLFRYSANDAAGNGFGVGNYTGSGGGDHGGRPNLRYGRHGGGAAVAFVPYNGKNIEGLSAQASTQYANILGGRESGNRYNITNSYGYVGRWQMGAAALIENGYVRPGTSNAGLNNPSAWLGKNGASSLSDFLANKNGVQDTEFGEYTNRHVAQLKAAGIIKPGMSPAQIAGVLAAAHLKGIGGAIALSRGQSSTDANGTSTSSYYGMMSSVGDGKTLVGPGTAAAAAGAGSSVAGQIKGTLKIGDETFAYGSGGARGSSSIPFGDYPINPNSGNPWGKAHDAMDVNGNGNIWDKALGRMRVGIEMHAASTAEMVTHGCLGFMKDEYPKLKARVQAMVKKYGHAYLHVGPNGATITPDKDVPTPSALAKAVHPDGASPKHHQAPAARQHPAGSGTTTASRGGNTYHIAIHTQGHHDEHKLASMVQNKIAELHARNTYDVDHHNMIG